MELLYCITHEQVVDIDHKSMVAHFVPKGLMDWDFCDGPFASCPPPELNENVWDIIFANEPDMDYASKIIEQNQESNPFTIKGE